MLIGIEMLSEHQKGDPDWQSWAQLLNVTGSPTGDELQTSSPYLVVLAQYLERIAEVEEMLVLREAVEGTIRVIIPASIIGEVIHEALQGPGTAQEGARKVLERLLH